LESARHKLKRAEEHLDALDAGIRAYFDTNPHRVTQQRDGHGRGIMEVEVVRDFPPELALIAGDAAHNLRSVVDHVVYAVSAGRYRRSSYFPVCTRQADYIGPREDDRVPMREDGLRGIPEGLLTIFDAAQPYLRLDSAHTHPLACVARLDNADKHRAIQPALAVVDALGNIHVKAPPRPGATDRGTFHFDWIAQGKRLTVGEKTEVLKWSIDPIPNGDVRVRVEPRVDVSFGQRATMVDLLAARDLIRDEIVAAVEAKIG
jgi:hypothetical protein